MDENLKEKLAYEKVRNCENAKDDYEKAQKKKKRFLKDRNLKEENIKKVYKQYFWSYLIGAVLIEFLLNYLLLDKAGVRDRVIASITALVITVGLGFFIGKIEKYRVSLESEFDAQKTQARIGQIIMLVVFGFGLIWLLSYRAGGNLYDFSFNNLLDDIKNLALVLGNIAGFYLAIRSGRDWSDEGWNVIGYGPCVDEEENAKQKLCSLKNEINGFPEVVYDECAEEVRSIKSEAKEVSVEWHRIEKTWNEFHEIEMKVENDVIEKYRETMRTYVDTFNAQITPLCPDDAVKTHLGEAHSWLEEYKIIHSGFDFEEISYSLDEVKEKSNATLEEIELWHEKGRAENIKELRELLNSQYEVEKIKKIPF